MSGKTSDFISLKTGSFDSYSFVYDNKLSGYKDIEDTGSRTYETIVEIISPYKYENIFSSTPSSRLRELTKRRNEIIERMASQ